MYLHFAVLLLHRNLQVRNKSGVYEKKKEKKMYLQFAVLLLRVRFHFFGFWNLPCVQFEWVS